MADEDVLAEALHGNLHKQIDCHLKPIVEEVVRKNGLLMAVKYRIARRIYRMKNTLPPAITVDSPMGNYQEWKRWFKYVFQQDLDDYIKEARERELKLEVMNFERDEYGFSGVAEEDFEKWLLETND